MIYTYIKVQLFVLHNTDTISFPLFSSRFLRYNKHTLQCIWTYWSKNVFGNNRNYVYLCLHNKHIYPTRSHTHTGSLVITANPRLCLNPPWDSCIYVYMTSEIPLGNPPRSCDPHSHWVTHTHRSIGYRHKPHPLTESTARYMHL